MIPVSGTIGLFAVVELYPKHHVYTVLGMLAWWVFVIAVYGVLV